MILKLLRNDFIKNTVSCHAGKMIHADHLPKEFYRISAKHLANLNGRNRRHRPPTQAACNCRLNRALVARNTIFARCQVYRFIHTFAKQIIHRGNSRRVPETLCASFEFYFIVVRQTNRR